VRADGDAPQRVGDEVTLALMPDKVHRFGPDGMALSR